MFIFLFFDWLTLTLSRYNYRTTLSWPQNIHKSEVKPKRKICDLLNKEAVHTAQVFTSNETLSLWFDPPFT